MLVEKKYLNELKQVASQKNNKNKDIKQNIEERVIRGLATIPYRIIKQLKGFKDFFAYLKDPIDKVSYIKKELTAFRAELKIMDLDLKEGKHNFLKFLDKVSFWRYYVILNDKVYNTFVKEILENPPDVNIVNKHVDTRFSERNIPEIYDVKHTNDLVKIIDKYIRRVEDLGVLVKKYPLKKKQFNVLLLWGIYGIRDLINVLHAIVSYKR